MSKPGNRLLVWLAVALAAAYALSGIERTTAPIPRQTPAQPSTQDALAEAWRTRSSDIEVTGSGRVTRQLKDDNDGSRHQRFILELPSGQSLLIAHNIDLAPRIDDLAVGDTVSFKGVYEWNAQGGVVHWTHHDPQGRRSSGWLKHRSREYR